MVMTEETGWAATEVGEGCSMVTEEARQTRLQKGDAAHGDRRG